MTDPETLDERLRAVERALTGDDDLADLRDAAQLRRDLDALADRTDELEERADELDAATQALRGYVGSIRAVNESVERRADAALAKAESLEEESRRARRIDRTGTCTCGCDPDRPERGVADAPEFERVEDPENLEDSESAESDRPLARVRNLLP